MLVRLVTSAGHRGRDGPRAQGGWRDRIRRSLSRGARDRQRQDGQERSRDRSSGTGGRRHGAEIVAALGDVAPAEAPLVLTGSGSASDDGACALELQPVRGRNPARQGSPRAARRRSQESLTPPVSPPLSPTSVLPRLARSRRDEARTVTTHLAVPSSTVLQLCSPTHLLPPLSPVKPPGFEASPTPHSSPMGRFSARHPRCGFAGLLLICSQLGLACPCSLKIGKSPCCPPLHQRLPGLLLRAVRLLLE